MATCQHPPTDEKAAPTFSLESLPKLSDIIWEIEKCVIADPKRRFGDWREHNVFGDELYDPWTQVSWDRYDNFLKAGREYRFFPAHKDHLGEFTRQQVADSGCVFSSVAGKAALEICGYKLKAGTPEEFRPLAEAIKRRAKAELEEFLTEPEEYLDHVKRHVLHSAKSKRGSMGEDVAAAVAPQIHHHLMMVGLWSDIVDLMDKVDWEDVNTLMAIASDPNYVEKEHDKPLCQLMRKVETGEHLAATAVNFLFDEWWGSRMVGKVTKPSSWHAQLKSKMPTMSDHEIQLRSLDQLSRLEKSLVRVCRPSLHCVVPYQISCIHASIIEAHAMIREYVWARSIADPAFASYNTSMRWGKGPTDSRTNKPTGIDQIRKYLTERHGLVQRTFRDSLPLWFLFHSRVINWSHYIAVDADKTIHFDAARLRLLLDAFAYQHIGCRFVDIMDEEDPGDSLWADPRRESEWIIKMEAQFQAMFLADDDSEIESDLAAISESIDSERSGRRISAPIKFVNYKTERTARHAPSGNAGAALDSPVASTLAQSGHAYRRDHGLLNQAAPTKPASTESPAITATSTAAPRSDAFPVTNKQILLLERLFGHRSGDVGWAQLMNVFKRIGCRTMRMGGSAYHIRSGGAEGGSMILHRPHPTATFTGRAVVSVGMQIATAFDWTIDNFARQCDIDSARNKL